MAPVCADYGSALNSSRHKARHFASDVFGAAVGVASGWTVVGRHGRDTFAMSPVLMRGGAGMAFTWQPGSARHGD
jgi:hypothetical protein